MTQRVLLTGGQEFLGRYAAARWIDAEPESLVLAIGPEPREDRWFGQGATWGDRTIPAPVPAALRAPVGSDRYRYEAVDPLDRPALTRIVQRFRPTRVVHLMEALRDEPADRLFRWNVEATVVLIEAVAGAGSPRPLMLFGSSGGVYGATADGKVPLAETDPTHPADLYSASRLAAENVSSILCGRYRIPAVRARIFNVLGPGLDERHFGSRIAARAAAIAEGARAPVIEVGPLNTTRDFIDVRDVARALLHLADEAFAGETFNVASGRETRMQDLLALILRAAGVDGTTEIRRRPGRPGDLSRHYASIEKLSATGFRPRYGLEETVAETLAYYRKEVRSAATDPSEGGGGGTTAARGSAGARPIHPDGANAAAVPLRVSAVERHEYEVTIETGSFARLPGRLRARFPGARMVLLTDDRVAGLYGRDLLRRMEAAGLAAGLVTFPGGEPSKSFETVRRLVEALREREFGRRSVLVNVGGGIVTDVGGFVAATYMRGVAYVNVPTTFLAQHDAATGGKVAANMPWAKNFVGAFHHPCVVFVDPGLLRTLDDRDISTGAAEAIKVAITGDVALFEILEREVAAIRERRDPEVLGAVIRRATARKIALLEPDPYEVDLRRALNLGHTFGHPLETECAYRGIRHGEAVAYGIGVAAEIARARGLCDGAAVDRIHRVLSSYGLPPPLPRRYLLAACRRVAEVRLIRGGRLHFVLPRGIDAVEIVDEVSDGELEAAVEAVSHRPLTS